MSSTGNGSLGSSLLIGDQTPSNEAPEENPNADPQRKSISGVRYADVLDGVHFLYPPEKLEDRNAESRSDGYWPFIQNGEDPPQQFTYGEFDFYFFAELLDRACQHYYEGRTDVESSTWDDMEFLDIGSGSGRLVIAASALHPHWKKCRGVEVLQGIHKLAQQTLARCEPGRAFPDKETPPAFKPDASLKLGGTPVSDEDWLESFKGKFMLGGSDEVENEDDDDDDYYDDEEEEDEEQWTAVGGSMLENTKLLRELQSRLSDETGRTSQSQLRDESDAENDENPLWLPTSRPAENEEISTGLEDRSLQTDNDSPSSDNEPIYEAEPKEYSLPIRNATEALSMAPVEFLCGSFEDPYLYFGDADCVFIFSSCMSKAMMDSLSKSIGRQCKPGTIVITTEFKLQLEGEVDPVENDPSMPHGSFRIDLVESIDGFCWLMGGTSTAHIHRVSRSLHCDELKYLRKPLRSKGEQALEAVKLLESQDKTKFTREVYNQMVFLGLPDSWLPPLE